MSDENGDLRDLCQELILDHSRHLSNFRGMSDATRSVERHNPLCGDYLRMYVRLQGERIADISFQGSGCAISVASASLLTERIKGQRSRCFSYLVAPLGLVTFGLEPLEELLQLSERLGGVREPTLALSLQVALEGCIRLGPHLL
jgi:nitrogen fixation protein NifU and related proteins